MSVKAESASAKIRAATNYTTTKRDDAVRLRIGSDGIAANEPISVPQMLQRTATNYPDLPALCHKDADDVWQTTTYSDYRAQVLHTAKAFIKLGLEPRCSVAILAFNSPEWFVSELAAIHAG